MFCISHSWFLCHLYLHTHTHTRTHEHELGFVGAKIPCAYGPADGDEGLAKNVEIFRRARESVGPDYPLMWASGVRVCVCVCGGGGLVVNSLHTICSTGLPLISRSYSTAYVPTTVLVPRADVWGEGTSGHYCTDSIALRNVVTCKIFAN